MKFPPEASNFSCFFAKFPTIFANVCFICMEQVHAYGDSKNHFRNWGLLKVLRPKKRKKTANPKYVLSYPQVEDNPTRSVKFATTDMFRKA